MTILDKLSTKVGAKCGEPNRAVAKECFEKPELLQEIAEGLKLSDAGLVGDCAEVMTMVAEKKPELILPYLEGLYGQMGHKKTRVRWEAAHALAYASFLAPEFFEPRLEEYHQIILNDKSQIVRDYSVDTLANLAGSSEELCRKVYPLLKESLMVWDGAQAKQALTGLLSVLQILPEHTEEIQALAAGFTEHKKKVVQKVAQTILKM